MLPRIDRHVKGVHYVRFPKKCRCKLRTAEHQCDAFACRLHHWPDMTAKREGSTCRKRHANLDFHHGDERQRDDVTSDEMLLSCQELPRRLISEMTKALYI